jgi:hypothetical protein
MRTLILSPRYTPDSIALREMAEASGWAVERLQSWRAPENLRGRDIVLYGEPLFAAVVAVSLDLALIEPRFDWLSGLSQVYTHRDVAFMTLDEARFYQKRAFIKPADDKCFRAAVYASGADIPAAKLLPEATPVLVAEPVVWESEFRCFVLEGRVATLSLYARHGEIAEFESVADQEIRDAEAFAQRLLDDPSVDAPPAFVLDVGVIAGRGWSVVEANPAWGAGIYRCDPRRVLDVLSRSCVGRENLAADDECWIIPRGIEL